MIYTDSMMNTNNVFLQLLRLMLCMVLLVAALPFVGLAAIFSMFVELPHIKIELGDNNLVNSVSLNLNNSHTDIESDTESESDTETESDEDLKIIPNNELADFLKLEHNQVTTLQTVLDLMDNYIEEYGPVTGTNKINWDPKLWNLLKHHKRTLTYQKMYDILSSMYTVVDEDSGDDADTESSPKIQGRVGGFEDNFPSTPVRSTSPIRVDAPRKIRTRSEGDIDSPISVPKLDIAQIESLMKDELTLYTGVKVRATTGLNDADITPIPYVSSDEESDEASGEQTPSELPPLPSS